MRGSLERLTFKLVFKHANIQFGEPFRFKVGTQILTKNGLKQWGTSTLNTKSLLAMLTCQVFCDKMVGCKAVCNDPRHIYTCVLMQ